MEKGAVLAAKPVTCTFFAHRVHVSWSLSADLSMTAIQPSLGWPYLTSVKLLELTCQKCHLVPGIPAVFPRA